MLLLANVLINKKVRYETVEVKSTKSPKGGKELRDLAIAGIAEAFAQPAPPADDLAAATKAYRQQLRGTSGGSREERRAKADELRKQREGV